ncbi:hypothetical protein BJV82DRAFT_675495 [Fennellomyces sp. T-0311]|nr:hypothetical protein BJV82DRAFT_675495 [Fennellomyces sp. T-0311]
MENLMFKFNSKPMNTQLRKNHKCGCGGQFILKNRARHLGTEKHLDYLKDMISKGLQVPNIEIPARLTNEQLFGNRPNSTVENSGSSDPMQEVQNESLEYSDFDDAGQSDSDDTVNLALDNSRPRANVDCYRVVNTGVVFDERDDDVNDDEYEDPPPFVEQLNEFILDFLASVARGANLYYPYGNQLEFRLRALFDGDDRLSSRPVKRQILALVKDVIEMAREDPELTAPTMHWVTNSESYKSNRVPQLKMTSTEKTISVTRRNANGENEKVEELVDLYMYTPSEVVKHLIANPRLSGRLSALLDKSTDACTSLAQGRKWHTCPYFQHPMVTVGQDDFWVGDFVVLEGDSHPTMLYKLVRFYTMNDVVIADACVAYELQSGNSSTVVTLS